MVSCNMGRAEMTATIKTFRPLIAFKDFKGLNTLNVLKPETLKPPLSYSGPGASVSTASAYESPIMDTQPIITMKKSNMFQASLI
jgi:hypothetical protein